jgi:hypothetical protein
MRTVKRSFRCGEAVDDETPARGAPGRRRTLAR